MISRMISVCGVHTQIAQTHMYLTYVRSGKWEIALNTACVNLVCMVCSAHGEYCHYLCVHNARCMSVAEPSVLPTSPCKVTAAPCSMHVMQKATFKAMLSCVEVCCCYDTDCEAGLEWSGGCVVSRSAAADRYCRAIPLCKPACRIL